MNTIGFPYISDIKPYVRRALTAAASFPYVPKSPWVRIVTGSGKALMSGELTGTFGAFENKLTFELRHMTEEYVGIPSITSIQVSHKGSYGSVRQVLIDWECFSFKDLCRLSAHMFHPGMSVLVEWGWGEPRSIQQMFPADAFENIARLFNDTEQLTKKVDASDGSYDGLLGIITDFSWTFKGNRYTCQTTVTTIGDIAFGVSLHNQRNQLGAVQEGSEVLVGVRDYIVKAVPQLLSDSFAPLYQADASLLPQSTGHEAKYISWGLLEHFINQAMSLTTRTGNYPVAFFDSSFVQISNHPILLSTDLSVCLIPNNGPLGGVHFAEYYDDSTLRTRKTYSAALQPGPGTSSPMAGYVSNIYVNLKHLTDVFKVTETLDEALHNLLSGISQVCGEIWNFKLKYNEDLGIVQVIDLNYSDRAVDDIMTAAYVIPSYNKDGAVLNSTINSKMSNEVTLATLLARHNPNREYNSTTAGGERLYAEEDKYLGRVLDQAGSQPVDHLRSYAVEERDRPGVFERVRDALYLLWRNEISTPFVYGDLARFQYQKKPEFLRSELYANEADPRNNITNNTIVPIELSVQLPGISGIAVGDAFYTDNIPVNIKDAGVFVVTSLTHDVGTSGWVTNVNGQLRIRTISNPIANGLPTALPTETIQYGGVRGGIGSATVNALYDPSLLGAAADDEDLIWLARTMLAECGQNVPNYTAGQILVGWCIKLRKLAGFRSDGTYRGTVLWPAQFSPYNPSSPRRSEVLSWTVDSTPALREALQRAQMVDQSATNPFGFNDVFNFFSLRSMDPPGVPPSWFNASKEVRVANSPPRNFFVWMRN